MPSAEVGSGTPRHRSGSIPIQGTPPPITRSSPVALRAPGLNRKLSHGRLPNVRSNAWSTFSTRVHAPAGHGRWMKMVGPARTRARAVAAVGLFSDDAAPFCHNGTEQSPAMESLTWGAGGERTSSRPSGNHDERLADRAPAGSDAPGRCGGACSRRVLRLDRTIMGASGGLCCPQRLAGAPGCGAVRVPA
jgi:hypothetical protein